MSTTASDAMNRVVDRFKAVRILDWSVEGIRFGPKLGKVAVEGEEVVQTVTERYATIVQDGSDKLVLADRILHLAAKWITQG
jgi:hypothetical protein